MLAAFMHFLGATLGKDAHPHYFTSAHQFHIFPSFQNYSTSSPTWWLCEKGALLGSYASELFTQHPRFGYCNQHRKQRPAQRLARLHICWASSTPLSDPRAIRSKCTLPAWPFSLYRVAMSHHFRNTRLLISGDVRARSVVHTRLEI